MTIRVSSLCGAIALLAVLPWATARAATAQASPPGTSTTAAAAPTSPDMAELAEQALRQVHDRLKLNDVQATHLRPLLTDHLARLRQLFADYSDHSGAGLPALMQEIRDRRDRFRASLDPILTPAQMKEYEVIRKEVDEQLKSTICDARLAVLKARLSLSPVQETRLGPILREDFEKKRGILAIMTVPTGGPAARRTATPEFRAIQSETEAQVRQVLHPEQMAAYEAYRDELKTRAEQAH